MDKKDFMEMSEKQKMECINLLTSPENKEIFTRKYIKNHTYNEIAYALGYSRIAIRKKICRAIKKM